jgi:hypothetical protein
VILTGSIFQVRRRKSRIFQLISITTMAPKVTASNRCFRAVRQRWWSDWQGQQIHLRLCGSAASGRTAELSHPQEAKDGAI